MKKELAVFELALMIVTMLVVSLLLETAGRVRARESYSHDVISPYSKSGVTMTAGESVESARLRSTSCCLSKSIYKESSDTREGICTPVTEIAKQTVNNGFTPIILIDNYKPKIPYLFMYKIPKVSYAENEAARHLSLRTSLSSESGFSNQSGSFYLRI